jgi:hypothetical protein
VSAVSLLALADASRKNTARCSCGRFTAKSATPNGAWMLAAAHLREVAPHGHEITVTSS